MYTIFRLENISLSLPLPAWLYDWKKDNILGSRRFDVIIYEVRDEM